MRIVRLTDDPGREDISMSAMDVTHRLIMESHRLYPIIPITMRHVMNTFVMDGYEIPVRTRVILAKDGSTLRRHALPRSPDVRHRPLSAGARRASQAGRLRAVRSGHPHLPGVALG